MPNIRNEKIRDKVLVYTLLLFSGNLFFAFLGPSFFAVVLLFVLTLLGWKTNYLYPVLKVYIWVLIPLLVIFILQDQVLGFVSWPGAFSFLVKILLSAMIVFTLKDKFPTDFFNAMYWLSLISLIGFVTINILKISIPGLQLKEGVVSYIVYSTSEDHLHQNQGMFWEPGAYAGVITLCLALNFHKLPEYIATQRTKLAVILLALLTTQSTTGYLAVFIMIFVYVAMRTKIATTVLLTPIFILGGIGIYNATDFLSEKVNYQVAEAINQDQGEFSNSRFGSLVFDWHYIQKHPLIGNGMHEKTRYADNPELLLEIQEGNNLGNGNGFSTFLASMGVVSMLGYLFLIYKSTVKVTKSYAFLVLLIIIINLQGESWMNAPLFLGMAFLHFSRQQGLDSNSEDALQVPD